MLLASDFIVVSCSLCIHILYANLIFVLFSLKNESILPVVRCYFCFLCNSVLQFLWYLSSCNINISAFHKLQQSDETANIIYHPEDFKGPVLFSFRAKSFFGKKKASIRVEDGEWSDKFSLDVAGSSGVVSCNTGGTTYQVLLKLVVLGHKCLTTPFKSDKHVPWPHNSKCDFVNIKQIL